ncbi:MAG: CHAD domain-containing protein [Planctomycetota bacterium]
MSYRIEPHRPVGPELHRIALEQLDRAGVLQDDAALTPAKRVHEVRKRFKMLRALMRLIDKRREQKHIRDIARQLSASRDAAVMAATFDLIAEPGTEEALRQFFHAQAERAASSAAPTTDVHRPLRESRARVAGWDLDDFDFYDLVRSVTGTYRKGRRAYEQACEFPSSESTHDWRKRVKDHWYHMRLMVNVCGGIADPRREQLDRLGELLGDANDCAVLRDAVMAQDPTAGILAKIDRRRDELVRDGLALGNELYAAKPKEFARSLLHCHLG